MNRYIFFDRDGVINVRLIDDYVKNIEEFDFIEEIFEIFKFVHESGYKSILITNQQGISKGLMSDEDLEEIHSYMQNELQEKTNNRFQDIYYCKALAKEHSFHRKPMPGMVLDAIGKYDVDTENSWFIGDSVKDAQAGKAAGLKTILIGDYKDIPQADFICIDHKEVMEVLQKNI